MLEKLFAEPVEDFFEIPDQEKLYVKYWPVRQSIVKGVIQVAHGLGETAGYYDEFSQIASSLGFAVYIHEARGHGKTAGNVNSPEYRKKAGDIGNGGIERLRDDLYALTKLIKAEYPDVPVFLLAHSLGSVIARQYLFEYGHEINGVILTGAPSATTETDTLLEIVEKEIEQTGLKVPSAKAFTALFQDINSQFEPVITSLDWITSDKEMVEASLKLPYTYVLFNNQFYRHFFLSLKEVDLQTNLNKIPKTLPIFLLSGGKDVITENGSATLTQYLLYKASGIQDVQYKIYVNKRHSILREVNRREVALDILNWISIQLNVNNVD